MTTKYWTLIVSLCTFGIVPFTASAEVRINEIAWMGGNGNANCEWIELYNTSDAEVDISGWSFKINETTNAVLEPAYPNDLVIEPYGYYVIARKFGTKAASATTCNPYFESFGSFHLGGIGALYNTSLSVILLDDTLTAVDTVRSTTINWSEYSRANSGNYDTVQRSGTTWSLNPPTPAAPNNTAIAKTSVTTASPSTLTSSETTAISLWDRDQVRSLSIVAPTTIYAGVPTTFSSITAPKDARKFKSHTWNFGDFTTSNLSAPTHIYANPGTYLVHLSIDGDTDIEFSKTITVVPPSLRIERLANGDLTITNIGTAAIDLASFSIVGDTTFVAPEKSIILAGATLSLPRTVMTNGRGLFSPSGNLVASVVEPPQSPQRATPKTPPPRPTPPILSTTTITEATSSTFEASMVTDKPATTAISATTTKPAFPTYIILFLLLATAVTASLIKTRLQ